MAGSKFKGRPNPNDKGRRNAELERSREKLMNSLIEFKDLVDETVLLANRTQPEKQGITQLLEKINGHVLEVDTRSVGEGSRTIGSVAMNMLLILKDEINQLKFHNFYLTKRVEELEGQESEGEKDGETEASDSEES